MAFTDSTYRGAMLVLLDGSHASAPLKTCPMCQRPLLRVFTTAGVRARAPQLPPHTDACITAKWTMGLPCPRAIPSKGLIDALMDAARA